MRKLKKIEKTTESYNKVIAGFVEINRQASMLIDEWRSGNKVVMTKINANGVCDLVTEVDKGIEELAINILGQIEPNTGVFSEENFKSDFSLTKQARFFVIDPIDGTKEFVKGSKEWSISLCLVENGRPVTASIFMPDRDLLFTAIINKGVLINGTPFELINSDKNRIAVSPRQIKNERHQSTIFTSGFQPIAISALTPKVCSLLLGEVEAAVYFPQTGQSAALWDYAAAVLLIEESGGTILSLDGNHLPFSGEESIHRNGWLSAKSPDVHAQLLSKLKI